MFIKKNHKGTRIDAYLNNVYLWALTMSPTKRTSKSLKLVFNEKTFQKNYNFQNVFNYRISNVGILRPSSTYS